MASPLFFMKIDLVLIGCGGTGGCFFSRMARFLSDMKFTNMSLRVRIIDGDHVEYKNLGRQPFIESDVGENKAVALAAAALESLDVRVKAYPFFLSPHKMGILHSGMTSYDNEDLQIIIGAVDNHACRKLLHDYFKNYKYEGTLFYLDAANEFSCGEIVIGKRTSKRIFSPDRAHYYPEILKDEQKPVYEMSCEELNMAEPQHLATNSMAADLLFAYVSQLLIAGTNASQAVSGIVYFDVFRLFSRFDVYKEEFHGKISM